MSDFWPTYDHYRWTCFHLSNNHKHVITLKICFTYNSISTYFTLYIHTSGTFPVYTTVWTCFGKWFSRVVKLVWVKLLHWIFSLGFDFKLHSQCKCLYTQWQHNCSNILSMSWIIKLKYINRKPGCLKGTCSAEHTGMVFFTGLQFHGLSIKWQILTSSDSVKFSLFSKWIQPQPLILASTCCSSQEAENGRVHSHYLPHGCEGRKRGFLCPAGG